MNDYTREVRIPTGGGYDLIYRERESNVSSMPIKWLHRYVLHKENKLWCIKATYAKSLKPNSYYVVAKNKSCARKKFKDLAPWLSYINSVEQITDELAKQILGDAQRYAIW